MKRVDSVRFTMGNFSGAARSMPISVGGKPETLLSLSLSKFQCGHNLLGVSIGTHKNADIISTIIYLHLRSWKLFYLRICTCTSAFAWWVISGQVGIRTDELQEVEALGKNAWFWQWLIHLYSHAFRTQHASAESLNTLVGNMESISRPTLLHLNLPGSSASPPFRHSRVHMCNHWMSWHSLLEQALDLMESR